MARTAIHPGEHLKDELDLLGISAHELARQLRIPADRLTTVISGNSAITAETAILLGHWFGTSAAFWMNLQATYDLRLAERTLSKTIKALPTRKGAAA